MRQIPKAYLLAVILTLTTGQLRAGQIYATTQLPGIGPSVIRFDTNTNQLSVVTSGGMLKGPYGIAVAPQGDLVLVDEDAFNTLGGLIGVNPVTGQQREISSGNNFLEPKHLAFDGQGQILVADTEGISNGNGGVIRVDPSNGQQSLPFPQDSRFANPSGIAIDGNGQIYITDEYALGGSIFRWDDANSNWSLVTAGNLLARPISIAVGPGGTLFAGNRDPSSPGIVRIDPMDGHQEFLTRGGFLSAPHDLVVTGNTIYATTIPDDFGIGYAGLVRVNVATGSQELLINGLGGAFGIAYVPEPSSLVLATLGLVGGLLGWRRRRAIAP